MVRFQAEGLVLVVVVEGQLPPARVGQLEHRIQRRIEPSGVDLGHDLLPRLALETEHVAVAGPIDAAVDDDRQRDPLGLFGRVVGLLLDTFRQRVPRERHAVERPEPAVLVKPVDARRLRRGVCFQAGEGEVPALHRDVRCFAGLAAERENAGHKGQLAQGHAINEILSAAEDRVVDFDQVLAVAGNFIVQHRIGMEAEAAGVGQFLALLVAKRDRGLEPARHGVGNVRHQLLGADGKDQTAAPSWPRSDSDRPARSRICPLTTAGSWTSTIGCSPMACGPWACNLRSGRCPGRSSASTGFCHDFRQAADLKDQGVRQSGGRFQPQFADAGLGVGRGGDLQHGRLGDGRIGLPVGELLQLLADIEDQLHFFRRQWAGLFQGGVDALPGLAGGVRKAWRRRAGRLAAGTAGGLGTGAAGALVIGAGLLGGRCSGRLLGGGVPDCLAGGVAVDFAAGVAACIRSVRALSCVRSALASCCVIGLTTSTTLTWMPGPETRALVTAAMYWPPTRTSNCVPCLPPAGKT